MSRVPRPAAAERLPAAARSSSGRSSPGTAWILGYRGFSELIARELEEQGFKTMLLDPATQGLPSLAHPQRTERLRAILEGAAAAQEGPLLLHPGVGTWAERLETVTLGQELGFTVLAPPVRSLSHLANRLNLLIEAEKIGVPNLLLSSDPIYSTREIEALIGETRPARFPLILKDVHGGGARGRQTFQDAADLERRLPLWLEQVRRNFGEVILFAERYLESSRAVTVPYARFGDGRFQAFATIDGSLQLRHRKVIEFCPAPSLDAPVRARLERWTAELAAMIGFVGVGAAEFLVDGDRAYLVDMAGSLTTSFPLWERISGTQAVAWQLAAFRDGELPEKRPEKRWSAGVLTRIYAEDSLVHLPQPGSVREVSEKRHWEFPSAQAEFVTGYEPGSEIAPGDTGLLGAIYAGALDRRQAAMVARGVLEEIWIAGSLQTNERFVAELLEHPWVKEGVFHAGFVEEDFIPALKPTPELSRLFAAVLAEDTRTGAPEAARWVVGEQVVKLEAGRKPYWLAPPERWESGGLPGISGAIQLTDGRRARVCFHPYREGRWLARIGNWTTVVRWSPPTRGPARSTLRALVSGRVHSVLFREGAEAPAHETLLVVESLGILVPHSVPVPVRIRSWKFSAEDAVRVGDELADVERLPSTS